MSNRGTAPFIFALVDLGMWTLNANQATNAARDGARAGILRHLDADVPGSDAERAIVAAVESHLDRDVPGVEIACVDPDRTELASCAYARVDLDRMRVEVEWDWTLLTRSPCSSAMTMDGRMGRPR